MARSIYFLMILVLSFPCILAVGTTAGYVFTGSFIKTACKVTVYPLVCVQTLSVHANTIKHSPIQLVRAALGVSLARADYTKGFVVKLTKFKGLKAREYNAIKDCLENMDDAVDRITISVYELKYFGKGKRGESSWRLSNVKTWVSAALTDVDTCLDGFSDQALKGRIKASVRAQVTSVAQVTSNALALVNHLPAYY